MRNSLRDAPERACPKLFSISRRLVEVPSAKKIISRGTRLIFCPNPTSPEVTSRHPNKL